MRDIIPNARRTHVQAITAGLVAALVVLLDLLATVPAQAGCGCEKPPPRAAAVRPNVTYAGQAVTLFSGALVAGQSYDVVFTAMKGALATVRGQAAAKRDLADGVVKHQLTVALPAVPLGPAAITVTAVGATAPLLAIADSSFTVAPQPIALPTAYGNWSYPGSQAAVGRDGVVYLSLDLTGMQQPLVFEAELAGYPLRFTAKDLVFTNTQGFLMQMLVQPATGEAIPGMFVYPATSPATTSDTLHYSRHEFSTYYLQHLERQPHAVDATDPNWHFDGSRHIDHDHLIVAIMGRLDNGAPPAPGATPLFDLKLRAYSLFHQGLVGTRGLSASRTATIDSFTPAPSSLANGGALEASLSGASTDGATTDAATTDGATEESAGVLQWDSYDATAPSYGAGSIAFGIAGDVLTDGNLNLGTGATVYGNATAASFTLGSGATITGSRTVRTTTTSSMQVQIPAGLPDLGALSVTGSQTITGPGSFRLASLNLVRNATLYIDNSAGPVVLYVAGAVTSSLGATIHTADPNPEKFAIYVAGTGKVSLGNSSSFYGVIFAPTSSVILSGSGEFYGAFLGGSVSLGGSSRVHYDETLRGK